MCRSVPQMPVFSTRISTSLMPMGGLGTSCRERPGLDSAFTSAFMPFNLTDSEVVSNTILTTTHDTPAIGVATSSDSMLAKELSILLLPAGCLTFRHMTTVYNWAAPDDAAIQNGITLGDAPAPLGLATPPERMGCRAPKRTAARKRIGLPTITITVATEHDRESIYR